MKRSFSKLSFILDTSLITLLPAMFVASLVLS